MGLVYLPTCFVDFYGKYMVNIPVPWIIYVIPKPQCCWWTNKCMKTQRHFFHRRLLFQRSHSWKMLGWNMLRTCCLLRWILWQKTKRCFRHHKKIHMKTKTSKKQSLSCGVIYICSIATGISHPAGSERHFDLHRSPVPLARYQVTELHALAFFSSFSLDFLSANSRFIRSRTSSPRSLWPPTALPSVVEPSAMEPITTPPNRNGAQQNIPATRAQPTKSAGYRGVDLRISSSTILSGLCLEIFSAKHRWESTCGGRKRPDLRLSCPRALDRSMTAGLLVETINLWS